MVHPPTRGAAEAILSDDDKEHGTAVVNIGGETKNLALYQRRAGWASAVIPLRGRHFTNHIAAGPSAPLLGAQNIKPKHGTPFSGCPF